MTTSTRNWADTDHYAALGVGPDASQESIGRAFRALAKRYHPDRVEATDADVETFKELTAAYEVLSDPARRHDYDMVRAAALDDGVRRRPGPMGAVPKPPATPMIRWTRRKATAAVVVGSALTLVGIAVSVFMVAFQRHEAAANARRIRTTAVVVPATNGIDPVLQFQTSNGVVADVVPPRRDTPGVLHFGQSLGVLYSASNPSDVVYDESHFGRDFTLWFVAVKLLVGGPAVTIVGIRRRRRFVAQ